MPAEHYMLRQKAIRSKHEKYDNNGEKEVVRALQTETNHLQPPTSNALLRSSLLLIVEKFSIFHVYLPYRSRGFGPASKEKVYQVSQTGENMGKKRLCQHINQKDDHANSNIHRPQEDHTNSESGEQRMNETSQTRCKISIPKE